MKTVSRPIKLTPLEKRMLKLYTRQSAGLLGAPPDIKGAKRYAHLTIGNQSFRLAERWESAAHALWIRQMLAKALANLVTTEIEEWNRPKVHGRDDPSTYTYKSRVELQPIRNAAEYKRVLQAMKVLKNDDSIPGQVLVMGAQRLEQYRRKRRQAKLHKR